MLYALRGIRFARVSSSSLHRVLDISRRVLVPAVVQYVSVLHVSIIHCVGELVHGVEGLQTVPPQVRLLAQGHALLMDHAGFRRQWRRRGIR